MKIILDASAAIEVILNRKDGELFLRALDEAESVLAPDLLFPEVTHGLWKLHEFDKLGVEICDGALLRLPELVDHVVSTKELYKEAFTLSRTLRKAAYNMFYLALAKRENATLLTLDSALKKEAKRQGIRVA